MEYISEARYAANRLRVRLEQDYRSTEDPQITGRYLDVKDTIWALKEAAREAEQWIDRFKVASKGRLLTNWDLRSNEDRRWLDSTTLSRPVDCHTCGHTMTTEGDFARHYVIPDLRHPNLGHCWTKEGDKRMEGQA